MRSHAFQSQLDFRGCLAALLDVDIPQQFVSLTGVEFVRQMCRKVSLPPPEVIGGNLVVGNIDDARFVLSAHLDEASFSVTDVSLPRVGLTPCHRFEFLSGLQVRLSGIRNRQVVSLGVFELHKDDVGLYVDVDVVSQMNQTNAQLGDRAVYFSPVAVGELTVSGKAMDDRIGAVMAVATMAQLSPIGIPVAVVLSDGEQNAPDGYFSRTFPHVLHRLKKDACLVFFDGIFQDSLEKAGFVGPSSGALIVPHSGGGRGLSVPPVLFAELRDVIVPEARRLGIDAEISSAYHSRGDDWGLVTNPTCGHDHPAFFVSVGGWGITPQRRKVNVSALESCAAFATYAITSINSRSPHLE